ncbi:MAG: DUF167 domain-containing protein [Acidimicrobiia bacterium]|nr:DUF167 domain-containing protein [Acidimicrobiia bacterium]
MTTWVTATETGSRLVVWVVPGASRTEVQGEHGNTLKVRVTAPPDGGRANAAVLDLMNHLLGAPAVLVRGESSRQKTIDVEGLDPDTVRGLLER